MLAIEAAARREFADVPSLNDDGLTLCERKVAGCSGRGEATISIQLAACKDQRSQATSLVNQMYSWRGYGADHQLASSDTCTTFTAFSDEDVIGTLTLGVDSPEGLAADATFKQELDVFRSAPEAKLCELKTFAFSSDVKSKPALATLFHTIFIYEAQQFGCTDVFIEVNPRHVRFYEVMLGFRCVGPPKVDATVSWWPSDLPVQLMRLNLADMRREIDHHAGASVKQGRSLYPFFLSNHEEAAVRSRVTQVSRKFTGSSLAAPVSSQA